MPDFNDLLESQIPRLRRYSRALTRDTQRADDLVQDTLVRALMKQDRWEPGTNLRAWLFTLMHNQYVNNVRRANREAGAIDIDDVSSSLVATTDPTASRQLYELERALGQLADEQREVILLVGLEGFSYEDAAKVLAVPVGTVRSRLSRGRESLRRQFGIEEEIDPTLASQNHPKGGQRAGAQL
jgi:RNA polymerase sigma-70 factor (ECF subfamily)